MALRWLCIRGLKWLVEIYESIMGSYAACVLPKERFCDGTGKCFVFSILRVQIAEWTDLFSSSRAATISGS